MTLTAIALLLFRATLVNAAPEMHGWIDVPTQNEANETILHIDYDVSCAQGVWFPGVTGTLAFHGHKLRFDLFEAKHSTEVQLGPTSKTIEFKGEYALDPTPGCTLIHFSPSIKTRVLNSISPTEAQVLAHSPILIIRDDQYQNRLTDLPLEMAYSMESHGKNIAIKYTLFFTDEDSESTGPATEAHMARYGRRTDIEWVYEVELDPKNQIVSESYQGFVLNDAKNYVKHFLDRKPKSNVQALQSGVGTPDVTHSTSSFRGQYLPGSVHPILYNIANNNVFSPYPDSTIQKNNLIGYHLVPHMRVDYPYAREIVMLKKPWIFKVSDSEMLREDKLYENDKALSDQYLYVLIDGELKLSSPMNLIKGFKARVELNGEDHAILSGFGYSDIDRLGEDMWGKEAYTAIPVGRDQLSRIGQTSQETTLHGSVSFFADNVLHANPDDKGLHVDLTIRQLQFFKLVKSGKTYETQEVTQAFHCELGPLENVLCQF